MKKILASLLVAAAAALIPAGMFATDSIAVVFNGTTEVNRETFMFFRKTISQTGYDYTFTAVTPTASIPAGSKGVIILNTGRVSGTDPALASFIAKNKGKATMVLVNLFQNQSAVTVNVIPAATSDQGVDTVSSASLWDSRGAGGPGGERPSAPPSGERPSGPPPAGAMGGAGGPGGMNPMEAQHLAWFKAALKLIAGAKA